WCCQEDTSLGRLSSVLEPQCVNQPTDFINQTTATNRSIHHRAPGAVRVSSATLVLHFSLYLAASPSILAAVLKNTSLVPPQF
ncbi:unnamed protein product, partial [Gadus morhua 'NCC']